MEDIADWVNSAADILYEIHYDKNELEQFILALGKINLYDDIITRSRKGAYFAAITNWIKTIASKEPGKTRIQYIDSLCNILTGMNWHLASQKISQLKNQTPFPQPPITPNINENPEDPQIETMDVNDSPASAMSSSSRPDIIHGIGVNSLTPTPGQSTSSKAKYHTSSSPKCHVLVLNFIEFDPAFRLKYGLKYRTGAEEDGKNLRTLFENNFKYDVTLKINASKNDIFARGYGILESFINCLAKDNSKAADTPSCVIVISTHGRKKNEKSQLAAKDAWFDLEDILEKLKHVNAPKLKGVPKMVLVNACRGNLEFYQPFKFETDSPSYEEKQVVSDLLVSFSTADDFVSSRHEITGSIFIQKFIEATREFYKALDIENILKEVSRKILEMCSSGNMSLQIVEYKSYGFHKNFFFE